MGIPHKSIVPSWEAAAVGSVREDNLAEVGTCAAVVACSHNTVVRRTLGRQLSVQLELEVMMCLERWDQGTLEARAESSWDSRLEA